MTRVIRFTANWCGPCQMFKPVFESVQLQFANKGVSFSTVDVDASPELARKYGVRSIPTTVIERDGQVIQTMNGVLTSDSLQRVIQESTLSG